ncbi:phytoene/squalene synthase family protein [Corynebacterium uberis]|uniref:phytoene/squalene synthase family protein n=1 Tax=Corynebacterium TaxID=1716 RepID=UPI001D0A72C2|nr:phytoene/squalene synthase family protein [Corynebacterium uberis]MCZ9310017.1 phytoene/squalene synthase family protein [Corynebacterium sp. c6VSa_13]UDL73766.1 phytoene/squalene synthase family protein [Corynebacterium uberis]UDL75350.1 phytoene/squalene synthase family protein [Corynebacterium uberis]UDL77561.1 phytoene/squalene synthase family protein [Corynebacterium uberis]UDL79848.1 phytoene/squalene synthase family protein [Corynebacterium uberis]
MQASEKTVFDRMSRRAAAAVIAEYSTSFSLATRLLGRRIRQDICALYAVVRIADEIVDGAAQAHLADPETELRAYQQAVLNAPQRTFHTDPVLHAYARMARRCQLDPAHMDAFFASMRTDLTQTRHTATSLDGYIYGSAEVIGLMCLTIFFGHPVADPELTRGARRLGAAFQQVNFLRDKADDATRLGRDYLPAALTHADKDALVASVRADLALARQAARRLPTGARLGVRVATGLYEELVNRLDATPPAAVTARRVRVPGPAKARVLVRELIGDIHDQATTVTEAARAAEAAEATGRQDGHPRTQRSTP